MTKEDRLENMDIELLPVMQEDIEMVWKMQVEAFSELLEKYQDYDTNPAAEEMDKVIARFEQPWTNYYFIWQTMKRLVLSVL